MIIGVFWKKERKMNIEIITKPLDLALYGYSGIASNKDYVSTAFRLSDKVWQTIKSNKLDHEGMNIWVYDDNEHVFAGVQLKESPAQDIEVEKKIIRLEKYAYYKHIGPYHFIKQAGQRMIDELKSKNLEITSPYIEIYGHWNSDESKLETELLMALK